MLLQFVMCLRITNFQLFFNWITLQLITNFNGFLDILTITLDYYIL